LAHVAVSPRVIKFSETPVLVITTDASLEGWGAHSGGVSTGGRWKDSERTDHINVLELRAILLALQAFANHVGTGFIQLFSDNTTAIAYVNKLGGVRSLGCYTVANEIWDWAEARHVWLQAVFLPGRENTIADTASRHFKDHLEWSVSDSVFEHLCEAWGSPEVDLFASRLNYRLPRYVSWGPDPGAWKIDAFSFSWGESNLFFYVFPPFSLLARVARKILLEGPRAILLGPDWKTQPWQALVASKAKDVLRFGRAPSNLLPQGPLDPSGDVGSTPLVAYLF
jgi:hypothetical protein